MAWRKFLRTPAAARDRRNFFALIIFLGIKWCKTLKLAKFIIYFFKVKPILSHMRKVKATK
jgi:hypothetical protein